MAKREKGTTDPTKFTDNTKKKSSVGPFPKITSICKIKQLTCKKGGKDIRFDDFAVSSDQTSLLDSLLEAGEQVQVTISVIQGQLPGT